MPDKGRAAIYRGLGHPMEIVEYPVPEPEPGAVLVKVRRANICGSDIHIWRGDIDIAAMGAPLPIILGHETVGTVARLGEGVVADSAGEPLAVGDRVVHRIFYTCGHCRACLKGMDPACPLAPIAVYSPCEEYPHFLGAYAEYYYIRPGQKIFKVPDDLTDEMAAPVNCALAQVIYGLERVGFGYGETIAIQGAGGLGICATAVAREMGAEKVIVIDGIEERLELARAFGADEVIDMNELKTPEERFMRVRELTGGWGADVVAELVGYPHVIPEGIDMLGNSGRYLSMGTISLGMTYEADPALLVMGNKSIVGVMLYGPDTLKKALDFLRRAKDKYPFDRVLSRPYALEEINKAFEEQEKGLVTRATIIL
ncbi:MAG TPA: zinc-binding dehydrogenase [Dehalococcoidia bacterium]|nr:zinc-binding dehydrogenase [Dehalococcoidia bacterium]